MNIPKSQYISVEGHKFNDYMSTSYNFNVISDRYSWADGEPPMDGCAIYLHRRFQSGEGTGTEVFYPNTTI